MDQSKERTSFRGQPIPQVVKPAEFEITDSDAVMEIINIMSDEEKKELTIESVNFKDGLIDNVKLTTGMVVTVETAIALAEADLLKGYTVGTTMNGGRTLRSKPSNKNRESISIYKLPRF